MKKTTKETIVNAFCKSCEDGNIALCQAQVAALNGLSQDKGMSNEQYQEVINLGLVHACKSGHLNIVRYLLLSEDVMFKAQLGFRNDNALWWSCYAGHQELIAYLLSSDELGVGNHANINNFENPCLVAACRRGHTELVNFLLTSDSLKVKADINIDEGFIIYIACEQSNTELVKLLLQFPGFNPSSSNMLHALHCACYAGELENMRYLLSGDHGLARPCIHAGNDEYATDASLIDAYLNNHLEIVQSLIFEYGMQVSEEIENLFNTHPNEITHEVRRFFQIQKLKCQLEKSLADGPARCKHKL